MDNMHTVLCGCQFMIILLCSVICTDSAANEESNSVGGEEPEFIDVIENVTVPLGRNVRLACTVRNLGSFKVAWMHFEQSAILTVNTHVITRNSRITVSHDKHRTWYLHINNVQEADRGRYMCQLNTITAKTQYGYLNVVVPPNIDDSLSSGDVIVREGNNITLTCHSFGFPEPTIKWKRDDGSNIAVNKTYSVSEWEGSQVSMMKISRLDMGAYLCIASNSVPPSVSKRIKVSVDFPPQLRIPHQLVSVPLGFNVTLECFTEAYPTSLNYWTRNDAQMLHDSEKYKIENEIGKPPFKTRMKLTISNISKEDLGTYKCIAKNPRGETDGTIRLYVSEQKTTTAASTTASTTARPKYLDVNVETASNEISHEISRKKDGSSKGSSPEVNSINKPVQKMRGFKGALSKNDGSNFNNQSPVYLVFKTMLSMTILLLALQNS